MTRDLGDLMWGAVHERSEALDGLVPEAADRVRLHSRVVRGRTVRHVREAALAVPVVAAVVAAGWFGVDSMTRSTPPAETPEPAVTTPAPTPTREEDSDELVLGDPIDEPGVPVYYAMPDGLLDHVEPGWVLASYAPREVGDAPAFELVFAIAPDGTRFAVARLEVAVRETADGPSWVEHVPAQWDGGGTAALREVTHTVRSDGESADEGGLVGLDLAAGVIGGAVTVDDTPDDAWGRPPADAFGRMYSPEGRVVLGADLAESYTLDPDTDASRSVDYGVQGRVCSPIGWLDASSMLAVCVDDAGMEIDGFGGNPRDFDPMMYRVFVDGGAPEVFGPVRPADPWPESFGVWLRDGVVAFSTVETPSFGCWTGAGAWVDGEIVQIEAPTERGEDVFEVSGFDGVAHVLAANGCSSEEQGASLTAHDLRAGTSTVLVPVPAGGWQRTLTGWVVAH